MNLKFRLILMFVIGGLVYGQCENQDQLGCISLHDCEWIEDIQFGNCSNLSWQVCESYSGCYVDSNPGWYDNSGPYCTGGTYQIDNSYCEEIAMPDCSEMNILQCQNNNSCEWIEDIEIGDCSDITNSSECYQTNQCLWYNAGNYGYWYDNCYGGTYETDNSYCEEIAMPDCSEMNELQCDNDESCEWTDDIENLSCSSLTIEECANYSECNLDADCTQWGSWYTWICYEYGPSYCTGGNVYIDNSSCEEVQSQMGDINGDNFINILDVVETISLVHDNEYNYIVDMNSDGSINILDIIEMIGIILDT